MRLPQSTRPGRWAAAVRPVFVALALAFATLPSVGTTLQGPPVANAISTCQAGFSCATFGVTASGNGTGTVVSDDGGINCSYANGVQSGTCSAAYSWPVSQSSLGITVTVTGGLGSIPCDPPCSVEGGVDSISTGLMPGANVNFHVQFKLAKRTLTYVQVGSGTVSIQDTSASSPGFSGCGLGCAPLDYDYGSFLTLLATPAAGWTFSGWTGACAGHSPLCSIHLTTNTTAGATFLVRPKLTVTRTGDGTGTVTSSPAGISCGATCAAAFDAGTSVQLTATPDAGAVFSAWTGACAGQGAVCTLVPTLDTSTNAVFGLPGSAPPPASGPSVGIPQLLLRGPGPVSATSVPATVRWRGLPAGAPISAYDLQERTNGGAWAEVGLASPVATSAPVSLPVGRTVQFRVRAGDSAGHTGAWTLGPAEKTVAYQERASAVTYTGAWITKTSASAWAGHVREATAPGASATLAFTGWGIAVVAATGPSEGSVRISLDGVLVKTLSLHASRATVRQVVFTRAWSSGGAHTIALVVVGTSGHPAVDLDGFAILH